MSTDFERATLYEGVQFGVETTAGTAVPANKRLLGLSLELENMVDKKPYRPQGNKFFTTSQEGKEWTQGKLTGIQCYNDQLYLLSGWLGTTTPVVPANNSTWLITGATADLGFTFKGSVLAPATYTLASALAAAIGGMASVGVGNVKVTKVSSSSWIVQFISALGNDTSPITSPTGTPAPTIAAQATGTLTNRWKFFMNPAGPDAVTTLTIEKGAQGQATMAEQAPFGFPMGLSFKHTKNEASLSGDFAAQTSTDGFTMTANPTDVACVPIDMAKVSVFMGTSLNNMVRMKRILEFEFGATNRADGLMTLNEEDPSFSNRIEKEPDLTVRFFQVHDAAGQAMLANLRANQQIYVVLLARGPSIETGFVYKQRWVMKVDLLKPTTADVDGAYGKNYEGNICYDSVLGTGLYCEIDSPLTSL